MIVSASSILFSIIFTTALPTIEPSETFDTAEAVSASLTPKPTATGSLEIDLMVVTRFATSSTFNALEPVTPFSET